MKYDELIQAQLQGDKTMAEAMSYLATAGSSRRETKAKSPFFNEKDYSRRKSNKKSAKESRRRNRKH